MDRDSYFIVGIKGVAMCHIAVILKKMGKTVTGSDVAEEFITDEVLAENGISCQIGFDAASLPPETEVVVYSAAHGGVDNPLIQEAQKRSITVLSQADLLGLLMSQFTVSIAVCGSHGKTTTSSLLAYALIKLGAAPSYMIGSSTFVGDGQTFAGGDYRGRDYFVIEADEYGVNPPKDKTPKFLSLHPTHILCMNVDFDHPDMFENLDSVKDAFKQFFNQSNVKLMYCQDDPVLAELASSLQPEFTQSYGLSPQSKYKIVRSGLKDGKTVFSLENEDEKVEDIELSLYGEKNSLNAAGVIAVLLNLGFTPTEIKNAVKGFAGPKRRLEQVYEKKGTYLFDDYAHHPAEIAASVSALKKRFADHRIVVVFQPHTFSRTQALAVEFTKALTVADKAYILPIFASARENSASFTVTSEDLTRGSANLIPVKDAMDLKAKIKEELKPGDVVVTMGAGDVYKRGADIIEVISSL